MQNIGAVILAGLLITLGVAAIGAIVGVIVMFLWNETMPAIFHLPQISVWQGVCLVWLSAALHKVTFVTGKKN